MSEGEDSKLPYTPLPRSLTDDLGEDPARWLAGPLDPLPRIRGLHTVEQVRGWIAAERLLAKRNDRSPRDSIISALDYREEVLLEAAGMAADDEGARYAGFDPDPEPRTITLGITPDVLRAVYGTPDPGNPPRITPSEEPTFDTDPAVPHTTYEWDPDAVKARLLREVESAPAGQAVATDGGEDSGE